jgi:hypothetical protein
MGRHEASGVSSRTHKGTTMAMSQNPKAGPSAIGAGFDAKTSIERSLALALSPFRQGLRFYADFQRSALDTFTRATGATVVPVMASATRSPKPAAKPAVPRKRATTTKPATTKRPTAAKPATTKPATTKRPTAAKPAAAKPATTNRPTASKPAAAKAARPAPGRAVGRSASKKPAAAKAAPKRVLKSAARAKPAVAKAAKKVASKPSRPRGARAGAAKKA